MVWYSTFDVWPQSSLRSASLTLFLKNIKTFNIWNIVEIIEFWALSFHRSQIFHPRWEGIIPHALNIVKTYVSNLFGIWGHSSVHHLTATDEFPFHNSHIPHPAITGDFPFVFSSCLLLVRSSWWERNMSVIMHNGLPPSICLVCCQSFSFLSQVTSSDEFTKNEAGNQKLIQDLVWFEEPQRKIPKALSQKILLLYIKSPSRLCPSRRQALLYRLGPGSYQGSLDPRS